MLPIFYESLIVLALILLAARFTKRGSKTMQRFFIPSALLAGAVGLLLGPQLIGTISAEVTQEWAKLPKHLINIVFAGLFLGKVIPHRKDIWKQAGPMIAFGHTLAWGQYVIGIALTMLILTPVFGTNPLAGALIEISFEGGHGTAAGLAPTFEQFGWTEGTDIALGLATLSIIVAVASGVLLVNLHNRRHGHLIDAEAWEKQKRHLIRSGYNLIRLSEKVSTNPKAIAINIAAFALAIGIGWGMLQGFIVAEEAILGDRTGIRFFKYMPMFPLAMVGGLILQLILKRLKKQHFIQRRTAEVISAIALDLLIASAIATVSLRAIGDNLPVFITFGVVGIVWIMACFFVLAPRMFSTYWFQKGLTNIGQSMGMTATGLLLNRLIDPSNHTKAREAFAYKQLIFEPFMGGGLITATSIIFIYEFGSLAVLIVSAVVFLFWLILGLRLGKTHKS